MDCVIEHCQSDCTGACRRWILGPTVKSDNLKPAAAPKSWVSAYLKQPQRPFPNCLAAKAAQP